MSSRATLVAGRGSDATKKPTMRVWGFVAIGLAAIGSVASFSVVRAGGVYGAVYLIVNVVLVVAGAVLLVLAARSAERK